MRASQVVLLTAAASSWTCTAPRADLSIQAYGDGNGRIRYEGALAGPYEDVEALVETPCRQMMAEAVLAQGSSPSGYCVLAFISAEDGEKWFISHIAPLEVHAGVERSCSLPVNVVEPGVQEVLRLGGTRLMERGQAVWRPTLFLNQRTGSTWNRDVMVFSLEQNGTCQVYDFSGYRRVVAVWRDSEFVNAGTLYNEIGVIRLLSELE